jgi:hypothetical protein
MVAGCNVGPGSPPAAAELAPHRAAASTTNPFNHQLSANPYTCPHFASPMRSEGRLSSFFGAFYLERCKDHAISGFAKFGLGYNAGRLFLAGWVARTRPLAGPLSPRGPQPVIIHVRKGHRAAQWAASVNCPGTRVLVRATLNAMASHPDYRTHNKRLIVVLRPNSLDFFD